MGRRSTVAALPRELVEACNGLIRDGHTIEEILAALQGMGAQVSRSAVGRYVKSARESMEKYRQAQEVAKVWVDKLEAEPSGDVGRLLPEMLRVVAFQTLTTMGESEEHVGAMDVMLLAKALKDIAGTQKVSIDTELQLRRVREQTQAKADAAARAAAQEMQQAGVSEATIAAIRQRILGVAAP
ncbi:phage protein Gp27 family protein [Ottowia pentelensis]|uniref:Phage protein Gp27 family protein n=1 Tax=Ottowia pentelensis TaxID=511108 RepID=A0ABV6PTL2_9BURK